jgi:hypothetical protein
MEEKSTSILKGALIPGVILGVILIIISLFSYIFDLITTGLYAATVISFVSFIIRILVLAIFTNKYRKEILGGFMKYGKALVFGIIMGVYASFIISAYTFVFNTAIDPDYTETVTKKVQEMAIENLYEKGMPDEMIEKMIEKMESKELPSPLKASLLAVGTGILFSVLASLLSSIFAKKNEDPYLNAMEDINEE